MTRRTDFTLDQWATLLDAVPTAVRAVAGAAGSSRQTEQELHEFVDLLQDAANEAIGDGLVGDLVADLRGRLASGGGREPVAPETAYVNALELARKAGAILAVVADPAQAKSVRDWFVGVLLRVGAAAREGGVLGIGGEAISPGEEVVIVELAEAFGADAPPAGDG